MLLLPAEVIAFATSACTPRGSFAHALMLFMFLGRVRENINDDGFLTLQRPQQHATAAADTTCGGSGGVGFFLQIAQ